MGYVPAILNNFCNFKSSENLLFKTSRAGVSTLAFFCILALMCNKHGYDSFETALRDMQKLNRSNPRFKLKRAYICWNCVKWHLTSMELSEYNK